MCLFHLALFKLLPAQEDSDLRTSTPPGFLEVFMTTFPGFSFTLVCCRTPSPGVSIEVRLAVQRGRRDCCTLTLLGPERVHRHGCRLILGSTWETECLASAWRLSEASRESGRSLGFRGKWRLTGCWGWEKRACSVYPCGRVERDWVRLRPRDGRSSGDRPSGPRNERVGAGCSRPGLGEPRSL